VRTGIFIVVLSSLQTSVGECERMPEVSLVMLRIRVNHYLSASQIQGIVRTDLIFETQSINLKQQIHTRHRFTRHVIPTETVEGADSRSHCAFKFKGDIMFKHSVVACALAAATIAVHAQSSVSISGIVDLGVAKGNGGTAANAGGNGTSKAWMQKQATPSRLVFRGTEDLGGGTSVSFVLDHRFTPDDGASSATFWGGRSLLEIGSAKTGTLYMGRDYSPAFWPAFLSDPFQWGGVGQIGLPQFAGFSDTAVVRTNNTLGYLSPRLGGVTVRVATGLGEGVVPRDDGISVDYRANGIYAAVGFQKLHGAAALGGGNSLSNLALHYDFGVVKPMLYVARSKTAGGTVSNQFWNLAAVAPFGADKVKVAYSQLTPGKSAKQTKISLGYEHYLSKRTNVYLDAGSGRESGKSTNTAYGVGIRHTF